MLMSWARGGPAAAAPARAMAARSSCRAT
jgi:hypothetical protein